MEHINLNRPWYINRVWRKWTTFCRRHVHVHFLQCKYLTLIKRLLKSVLAWNWKYVSFSSGMGLATSRWQGITWSNGYQVPWINMAYLVNNWFIDWCWRLLLVQGKLLNNLLNCTTVFVTLLNKSSQMTIIQRSEMIKKLYIWWDSFAANIH